MRAGAASRGDADWHAATAPVKGQQQARGEQEALGQG
jgi:hypothetical protein